MASDGEVKWTTLSPKKPNPFVVTFTLDGSEWDFTAKPGALTGNGGTKEEADAIAFTLELIAQKIRALDLPPADLH